MYFVIARLDAPRLARMEFMVNFGVGLDMIRVMHDIIEAGGTYEEVKRSFKSIPFLIILKIYKYFYWADKRLYQVFFIENKDDISEDLLSDFKDPENEAKFSQPKVLSKEKS